MGCGVSRMDSNGMVFPAKLRPVFLYRLEEIKTRRHARPHKKELLLHDHEHRDHEDGKSSSSDKNAPNKTMLALSPKEKVNHEEHASGEEKNGENAKNDGKEKKTEEVNKAKDDDGMSTDGETDGGDRTDDDERMIGHDDVDGDGAFRGSPSFRVYFKENGEEKRNAHENDAIKNAISSDEAKSLSKESCENNKLLKSGRKKSSKNKGVKNLLNYKSCYNTTPSSGHDQANLLTGKTTA